MSALVDAIKEEMKQNYDFVLFYMLPEIEPNFAALTKNARKLGLEADQIQAYMSKLLEAKLWTIDGDRVHSVADLIELGDITVQDYLSMTVCIISRLSDDKSHSYDTLSVVTNRQQVRTFVQKVNQCLKEFYNASQAPDSPRECLFSWSHTAVIELEVKKQETEPSP